MKKYIFEVRTTAKAVLTIKADTEEEALRKAHDGADEIEWASFDEAGGREVDLLRTEDELITGFLLSWWHPELGIYLPSELAVKIDSDIWDTFLNNPISQDYWDTCIAEGLIDRFGSAVLCGQHEDWDFRLGLEDLPKFSDLGDVFEGESSGESAYNPYGSNRYQVRRVKFHPTDDMSFKAKMWLGKYPRVRFALKSVI